MSDGSALITHRHNFLFGVFLAVSTAADILRFALLLTFEGDSQQSFGTLLLQDRLYGFHQLGFILNLAFTSPWQWGQDVQLSLSLLQPGFQSLPLRLPVRLRLYHQNPFAPFLHLTIHFGLNSALKKISFCHQLALTSGVFNTDQLQRVLSVIRCLDPLHAILSRVARQRQGHR